VITGPRCGARDKASANHSHFHLESLTAGAFAPPSLRSQSADAAVPTGLNDALEDPAEHVALPETFMAGT
jgi:hypothetical protein